MTQRLQFDSLGIAAFTVVVAAVVGIGRQFFDAGALLASVLFPACLLFALGSLQIDQPLQPEEWELLSKLKKLKRLDLANMVVDENRLRQVGEISTLENISFRNCEIAASC